MFLIFLALWIILNGRITLEIVLVGLVISGLLYALLCTRMGHQPAREWYFLRLIPRLIRYGATLVFEIIKANFDMMRMILTPRYEVEPVLITVHTDLKTNWARVLLANSITLTPGTITVSLEGDRYTVHCLDCSLADGIMDSVFVRQLREMEAIG